jgi:hypothetical protein
MLDPDTESMNPDPKHCRKPVAGNVIFVTNMLMFTSFYVFSFLDPFSQCKLFILSCSFSFHYSQMHLALTFKDFIKGSLTRDFRLQVFFTNQISPWPLNILLGPLKFLRNRGDIRNLNLVGDTGDVLK